jgi:hypothetical protein
MTLPSNTNGTILVRAFALLPAVFLLWVSYHFSSFDLSRPIQIAHAAIPATYQKKRLSCPTDLSHSPTYSAVPPNRETDAQGAHLRRKEVRPWQMRLDRIGWRQRYISISCPNLQPTSFRNSFALLIIRPSACPPSHLLRVIPPSLMHAPSKLQLAATAWPWRSDAMSRIRTKVTTSTAR